MAGVKRSLMKNATLSQQALLVAHAITTSKYKRSGYRMTSDEWWNTLREHYEKFIELQVHQQYGISF